MGRRAGKKPKNEGKAMNGVFVSCLPTFHRAAPVRTAPKAAFLFCLSVFFLFTLLRKENRRSHCISVQHARGPWNRPNLFLVMLIKTLNYTIKR